MFFIASTCTYMQIHSLEYASYLVPNEAMDPQFKDLQQLSLPRRKSHLVYVQNGAGLFKEGLCSVVGLIWVIWYAVLCTALCVADLVTLFGPVGGVQISRCIKSFPSCLRLFSSLFISLHFELTHFFLGSSTRYIRMGNFSSLVSTASLAAGVLLCSSFQSSPLTY